MGKHGGRKNIALSQKLDAKRRGLVDDENGAVVPALLPMTIMLCCAVLFAGFIAPPLLLSFLSALPFSRSCVPDCEAGAVKPTGAFGRNGGEAKV